ncbi:hypothetical protein bAD24_I05980 [Burkholderia sp. AD24]|nr:hypothetical protein bAD24_I05980 [Burkholderia sp. AD24]
MKIDSSNTLNGTEPQDDDRLTTLAVLEFKEYIGAEPAEAARQRLIEHPEIQFETGATRQLLDWLIAENYTDRDTEEKATLQTLQWSQDPSVEIDKRLAILMFTRAIDSRIDARLHTLATDRQKKKAKTSLLINAAVVVVILGGFGIYRLMPDSTPSCTSSSTTSALDSLFFEGAMKSMAGAQMLANGGLPHARNYREVGYDSRDHSRGCLADLGSGAEKTQIGYMVRRTPDDKDNFAVQAFPPEYISSRYDAATLNNTFGKPVGRENMESAIKAALTKVDGQIHGPAARSQKTDDGDQPATLADSVLDVVPTADCKQLADGRQSCPVTIDYRDDLMAIVGAPAVTKVRGEFVFVKNGGEWAASDDFPEAFMKAVVGGRIDRLQQRKAAAAASDAVSGASDAGGASGSNEAAK